jgi:hypothetical protein
VISITARSKKSGSATRIFRNESITGSFRRQRPRMSPSHWLCGSSSMIRAVPWIVARSGLPFMATGSLSATATFGLRLMCSSFLLKRVDECM